LTRHRIVTGVLALLTLIFGAYLLTHPAIEVRISRDVVQAKIDDKLPLHGEKRGFHYTIRNAVVDLRPDGRVGMISDVDVVFLLYAMTARVAGSGVPIYRDGSFYLAGFAFDQAPTIDSKMSAADRERFGTARNRVLGALRLDPERVDAFIQEHKAEIVDRLTWAGETEMHSYLDRRAIYTLRPDSVRQSLARLALQSLRVERDELVVILDPMTAVERGLAYLIAAGLGLVLAAILFAAIYPRRGIRLSL
jgi:hypothetical protein